MASRDPDTSDRTAAHASIVVALTFARFGAHPKVTKPRDSAGGGPASGASAGGRYAHCVRGRRSSFSACSASVGPGRPSTPGGSTIQQAAETVRTYAEGAAESFQGAAQQASERVSEGMREGRYMIRRHPFESVATCFGIGVVTGVILGILMRSGK